MGPRLVAALLTLTLLRGVLPPPVSAGGEVPLVGTVWQWHQTRLSDGTAVTAQDPTRYAVVFFADGTVMVTADCHTVMGRYQAADGQLTLTLGPTILVGCSPESQVDSFVRALLGVDGYRATGNGLLLTLTADAGAMHFVPLVSTQLVETEWVARALHVGSDLTTPIRGTHLSITFSMDGKVAGSSGCNRFTGPYQIRGETLTFGAVATTQMVCALEIMEQEQAFLDALGTTTGYQIVGAILTFADATGGRAAEFVRPE